LIVLVICSVLHEMWATTDEVDIDVAAGVVWCRRLLLAKNCPCELSSACFVFRHKLLKKAVDLPHERLSISIAARSF
jgi:hypothetical protein